MVAEGGGYPDSGHPDWFHPWLTCVRPQPIFMGDWYKVHVGEHTGSGHYIDCPQKLHHHCDPKCPEWQATAGQVRPQMLQTGVGKLNITKGPLYSKQIASNVSAYQAKTMDKPYEGFKKNPFDDEDGYIADDQWLKFGDMKHEHKFNAGGIVKSAYQASPSQVDMVEIMALYKKAKSHTVQPPAQKPAPNDALAEKIYDIAKKHGCPVTPFAAKEISSEVLAIMKEENTTYSPITLSPAKPQEFKQKWLVTYVVNENDSPVMQEAANLKAIEKLKELATKYCLTASVTQINPATVTANKVGTLVHVSYEALFQPIG